MPMRQSKIAPAFFIGLGGCGGAIVDELARKVKQEESFERYQDLIHFFALDSDSREPDGFRSTSVQAEWLRTTLASASQPWKIVYMHHPPYSSGYHGSVTWMRWPFQEWGASIVLAGHDHVYERLEIDGFPYITAGLGGYPARYAFLLPLSGSQVRYNDDFGALLGEATAQQLTFQFITRNGELIDTYQLSNTP